MATSSPAQSTEQQISLISNNDLDDPHELYLMILNTNLDHILAEVVSKDLLTLPAARPLGRFIDRWPIEVEKLEQFIKEDLGLTLRVLRPVHITGLGDLRDGVLDRDVIALEIIDEEVTLAASLKWIHRRSMSDYSWVNTHDRFTVSKAAEQLLQELNYEASYCDNLMWWQQPRWHEYITSWTKKALKEKGLLVRSEIRTCAYGTESRVMTCHAQPSSDIRVPSTDEDELLYIKATMPQFREVARTVAIAKALGPMVPEVVAYDTENGIMVQRDAGRTAVPEVVQEQVMNNLKRIQSLSVNDLTELEKSGVEVCDMKWMFSNLERILNDPAMNEFRGGNYGDLVEYVQSHAELIKTICRDVYEWNLPNVLVHADAHPENFGSLVSGEEGYYPMFDWAKAFIGPPLYDVWMMDDHGGNPFSVDSAALYDEFGKFWHSYIPHSLCKSSLVPMELFHYCKTLYHCNCLDDLGDEIRISMTTSTLIRTLRNFVYVLKGLEDKVESQE